MAITKILHMKESKKCKYLHLKNAITYILNHEKTAGGALIGGGNCIPRHALKTMLDTKKYYGKEGGRQGYHMILSFAPGEAAPDLAFEIMGKFAERYLGSEWEYVYAAHDDKEHAHAHLVFNSVNLADGHKFHYKKGDWLKSIQPITNELCKEYGLSEITLEEQRSGNNMQYAEWEAEKKGRMNWRQIIRNDIDRYSEECPGAEEILKCLQDNGYEIKYNEAGEILFRPYGKKGFVSAKTLGGKYDKLFNSRKGEKDKISDREITQDGQNAKQNKGNRQPRMKTAAFSKGQKDWSYFRKDSMSSMSQFQKMHLRKYYRTTRLRYHYYKGSKAWKYKKDILRLHELNAQCQYIWKHNITSLAQLEQRDQELLEERHKLNMIKRHIRAEGYPDQEERLARITEMQKALWKERRIIERIKKESLETIARAKEPQKEKEKEDEERDRRGRELSERN